MKSVLVLLLVFVGVKSLVLKRENWPEHDGDDDDDSGEHDHQEILLYDEDGNRCLQAALSMKIIGIRYISYPHNEERGSLPVETSYYDGICSGEAILAGKSVQGPAVAFTWNATEKGDVQDTVYIFWKRVDDMVYIDRVELNVTLMTPHGSTKIEETLDHLQLFPSAVGSKAHIDLSEIRFNDNDDEFIFCRGEYIFDNQSGVSYLLIGLAVGIAIVMFVGIVIFLKGTRKKNVFVASET